MDFLVNFMKDASKLFDDIYEWIVNTLTGENVTQTTILPSHIYDIYYHFKLLKKEGELKGIQLGQLELDFFDIILDGTPYIIKVYKKDNKICTNLYCNNEVFDIEEFYTDHQTYESIKNEISDIYNNLHEIIERNIV